MKHDQPEIPRPRANPQRSEGRYLRNAWYVAGWSDDLAGDPIARTFLDQPVALFRDDQGVAHAIGGRCPHRFAALGHGRIIDNQVECPYHGLRFDVEGRCAFNPHEKGVVPRVSVPRYALVERHALMWIWMGEADRADPAMIPDFSWLCDPRFEAVRGTAIAEGNYELYSDNILDLSHSNYVHPALTANGWTVGKRRFRQDGNVVWSEYAHPDDYLSEGISAVLGTHGRKMDFYCDIRWNAPAVLFLDYRAGDPGTPKDDTTSLPSLHAFTPETEGSTHYFWAVARDFALGDEAFSAAMHASMEHAFESEDMPVIRDAWRLMNGGEFWDLQPVVLTGDAGGVRARRILEKLIREEEREGQIAAA